MRVQRIVLYSADSHIIRAVTTALSASFAVQCVTTTQWLRVALASSDSVILFVDGRMPDAVECTRLVRATSAMMLIGVQAKRGAAERVRLLDAGADDVVLRSAKPEELRARVAAKLRRAATLDGAARAVPPAKASWHAGAGQLPLSPTELRLLTLLQQHDGTFVSATQLQHMLWNAEAQPGRLRFHISHLRRRLASLDHTLRIEAQRGYGYRLIH